MAHGSAAHRDPERCRDPGHHLVVGGTSAGTNEKGRPQAPFLWSDDQAGGDRRADPDDHGRSPNRVVLSGELGNSRMTMSPILRPISEPSRSALRKWMPPQTRA